MGKNPFGTEFGDGLREGDAATLDGMGMGGEFTMAGADTGEVGRSKAEASMKFGQALADGMDPESKTATEDRVEDALDVFGVDYF